MLTLNVLAVSLKATVSPLKNTSGVAPLSQLVVVPLSQVLPLLPFQTRLAAVPVAQMRTWLGKLRSTVKV